MEGRPGGGGGKGEGGREIFGRKEGDRGKGKD